MLCSGAQFLTYYAHVKDVCLIHLYHKNFKCNDCSIRVYLKFYTLTGAQIIIIVDVLLE